MKKILCALLSLGIISLMLGGISPLLSASNVCEADSTPSSAALSGNPDWNVLYYNAEFDYNARYLYLYLYLNSPTGSSPSEILANVNGTNHSLSANNWVMGNNIKYGVFYSKVIVRPDEGMVYVKFHIKNTTAEIDSDYFGTYTNKTANVTYAPIYATSPDIIQTGYNRYEFRAGIMKYSCASPVTVKVKVNASEYTMKYNVSKNAFILERDFGLDDEAEYAISFIYISGAYSFEKAGYTIYTSKVSRIPEVSASVINSTINGNNKTVNFFVNYWSYDGKAPTQLNLSINGVWQPLKVQPWIHYYAYQSVQSYYKISANYSYKNGIEKGARLGPFSYNIENGKTYNMTVYAKNATEFVNQTILNNQTEFFAFKPAWSVEILNATLIVLNSQRYLDIKAKLKFTGTETRIGSPGVYVYLRSPGLSQNIGDVLTNTEGSDYATGVNHSQIINLNQAEAAPWYGNVVYKINIAQQFIMPDGSIQTNYFNTDNITITGTAGAKGNYAITNEDWDVYNEYEKSIPCGCGTFNYTKRTLTKVFKIGYSTGFAADMFLTYKYYYSYDYKVWVCPNNWASYDSSSDFWGTGTYDLKFIDPNNMATFVGFGVGWYGYGTGLNFARIIPKDADYTKISTYIASIVGTANVKQEKKKFTFEMSQGDYKENRTIEYDSRGVLKLNLNKIKVSCYEYENGIKWINRGKGRLPTNDGTPLLDGYFTWILLLGFGLMTFGVISIILRKRKIISVM